MFRVARILFALAALVAVAGFAPKVSSASTLPTSGNITQIGHWERHDGFERWYPDRDRDYYRWRGDRDDYYWRNHRHYRDGDRDFFRFRIGTD